MVRSPARGIGSEFTQQAIFTVYKMTIDEDNHAAGWLCIIAGLIAELKEERTQNPK